ncbi:MAG: dUTP diphosphatase [Methanobrevibacter sp.]|nr:dUTP diphosphatase [Methanobrevibacter sp.]
MIVKVVSKLNHEFGLPTYATNGSAGLDLRANYTEPFILKAGERTLVPTGIYVGLPEGYEMQVRPRSGLALKSGVTVLNSPGTVDADYTGEVGVILINHSNVDFVINPGDRIAQAVLNKVEQIEWNQVETLEETDRGSGGFGHTGV